MKGLTGESSAAEPFTFPLTRVCSALTGTTGLAAKFLLGRNSVVRATP